MSSDRFDIEMMNIALRMAERGLGQTAPNPAVGAVIACEDTGEVIARGWTQPGGRPHAETEAIRRAGGRARGATMYVTLEPCAHHGKTPPCANAIIAAGLKRVVTGTADPDPRTAGKGCALLRTAGIDVTEGVLAVRAHDVSLGHTLRITKGRPFVQLKLALSVEGTIPRGYAGQPVFATGPEARAAGHLLRAQADAILTGRKTVLDDDPELTCRLPGLAHRSPVRVVGSTQALGLKDSRLAATARDVPVWVFCGPEASSVETDALAEAGARIFKVPAVAGIIPPSAILEALSNEGITRLLVEGGPGVWKAFASAGLADEAVVFHAGIDGYSMKQYQQSVANAVKHYLSPMAWEIGGGRRIGADTMWRLRPRAA